jgi:hypothetical protein
MVCVPQHSSLQTMVYVTQEYKQGDRVAYIPIHAEGDITHKDVEQGEIVSVNHLYIFVRFDNQVTPKACSPTNIVKLNDQTTTTDGN